MNTSLVSCSNCNAFLLTDVFNLGRFVPCPNCGTPIQVQVFPALFRRAFEGKEAETIIEETEASCFYHPEKRAALPCDACGRFLCALCDCELNGQHLCPGCLESGKTKGKIKSLENHRTRYDSLALLLSLAPLTLCGLYVSFITAGLSLFVAIRYWNSPTSIVRRSKIRYILAIVISTLTLVGWGFLIYALIGSKMTSK
ncbi:hypothetical protein [Pedosphaera parvula]|uniref:B box-type domain-containing protein n=1 Tax=Pedosphaera parvula (strain Ellin514) TaxID=320771 RepID=B9XGE5_PEDPL|nr:hypothetical protein [Pedosphaera parvula]EEF60996.1 conserved hypothetical protein [Pedosphaera parvula Ellin514]